MNGKGNTFIDLQSFLFPDCKFTTAQIQEEKQLFYVSVLKAQNI